MNIYYIGDQNYSMAIDMWSRLNVFVYLNFILYLGVGCIFAELWTRIPIMQGNLKLFFSA